MSRPPRRCALVLILTLCGCNGFGDILRRDAEALPAYDRRRDSAGVAERPPTPRGVPYRQLRRDTLAGVGEDVDVSVAVVDGESWLVFASTRHTENEQIYIKKARARTVTLLPTFPDARNIQPRFHPAGRSIAFASDVLGNWDLYVLDLEANATPRQITKDYVDEFHPSWSPGGEHLVYCAFSPVHDAFHVWLLDVRNGFSSDLGTGLFPEWSPAAGPGHATRNKIVFQQDRRQGERWSTIWTMNIDGTQRTQIVATDGWGAINPSWNPRGDRIVFAVAGKRPEQWGVVDDSDDIWMVDVDGNNARRITYDAAADWDPFWAADGRIYFSSTRHEGTNIWSLEPVDVPLPYEGLPLPEDMGSGSDPR